MQNLKRDAVSILSSALTLLNVGNVIRQRVKIVDSTLRVDTTVLDLAEFRSIVLIAFGKASVSMAGAVEQLLGDRVDRGVVVTDRRGKVQLRSDVIVSGHPLPDEESIRAALSIIQLVRSCGPETLIIFMISGGGSSLVELPAPSVTLEDLRSLNESLVLSGAGIREINIVRKHLSQIKGGKLGCLAKDVPCLKLFLSDVNSGDLRSLASNPLLPESVSPLEPRQILEDHHLIDRLPASVRKLVVEGRSGEPANTVVWEDNSVTAVLLESNDAVAAAARVAAILGFRVEVATDLVEGAYPVVADEHIRRLRLMCAAFPGEAVCVISGGEVSCAVNGDGIGGRNQEFVLYSAAQLFEQPVPSFAVASLGSDGIDGNSSAAGAVADSEMVSRARGAGWSPWDFIRSNDTHSFFREQGGLVVTGPTGNNVRDLRILLMN